MAAKPDFRKPAPEGVVEQTGIGTGTGNGMVALDNGSLMMVVGSHCHISTDGGQIWGRVAVAELRGDGKSVQSVVYKAAVGQAGTGAPREGGGGMGDGDVQLESLLSVGV